jgi:hypothetical protein
VRASSHSQGVDHVGIGSDYDGCKFIPSEIAHVGRIPELVRALLDSRRYTSVQMVKLLGGNFLRVMRGAEGVARSWTDAAPTGSAVSLYSSPEGALIERKCIYQWNE